MLRPFRTRFALAAILVLAAGSFIAAQQSKWARDPKQPVDEDYTKKIKEYTTAPYFLSPLVDYLPASKTVPTPKAVIGDVAGAPGQAALLGPGPRLHADAREGQPAREGALDRTSRRKGAR